MPLKIQGFEPGTLPSQVQPFSFNSIDLLAAPPGWCGGGWFPGPSFSYWRTGLEELLLLLVMV
jgi:hypothetical protein